MTTRKTRISKQFTLGWIDLAKGTLVSALTSALFTIQSVLDTGSFNINWKVVAMSAIGGMVAYLSKNFFEPTKIITVEKQSKN